MSYLNTVTLHLYHLTTAILKLLTPGWPEEGPKQRTSNSAFTEYLKLKEIHKDHGGFIHWRALAPPLHAEEGLSPLPAVPGSTAGSALGFAVPKMWRRINWPSAQAQCDSQDMRATEVLRNSNYSEHTDTPPQHSGSNQHRGGGRGGKSHAPSQVIFEVFSHWRDEQSWQPPTFKGTLSKPSGCRSSPSVTQRCHTTRVTSEAYKHGHQQCAFFFILRSHYCSMVVTDE